MAAFATQTIQSPPPVFGRAGNLEVRLAQGEADIERALTLRATVFRDGKGDADAFDDVCDHLVVADRSTADSPIVGTYRLIGSAAVGSGRGFYSESEYDLEKLKAHADRSSGRLLELGRSCVHHAYRSGPTMLLLWRGIAEYLASHPADYLFGCASFPGVDPAPHASALSWLARNRCGPVGRLVRALPDRFVPMDAMQGADIDGQQAWRQLPPLVRGYLQAGAEVGDGAVVDGDFGTVDVFMILSTAALQLRHRRRFLATPADTQAVGG